MGHQDCMHGDAKLHRGQRIYSPNRALELIFQDDGNLVLYRRKDLSPLWASGTHGRGGEEAIMQGDGNFVIYGRGIPLWASNTHGHHGATLRLQNDGNLVVYNRNGQAVWASNTHGRCPESDIDCLRPGEKLLPGRAISTRSGNAELIMQTDGNLVLYRTRDHSPLWASNTHGQQVREAIMQTDGNLVIYDARGSPIWASNTHGKHNSDCRVQDDGNFCIYWNGQCSWASHTHGRC